MQYPDKPQIRALFKKCVNLARKKGFAELGEDFAQWHLEQMCKGMDRCIYFSFCIFLRNEFGSRYNKVNKLRLSEKRYYHDINIAIESTKEGSHPTKSEEYDLIKLIQNKAWVENERFGVDDFLRILQLVDHPMHRLILFLFFHEEYQQREIARMGGMPESTVDFHIDNALEELRCKLKQKEFGEHVLTAEPRTSK